MSLFPLIVGPTERAALAELVAKASASPTDYATMKSMAEAPPSAAARLRAMNRAVTVEIPQGYTVTLTHEEHKPGVMCRHISIGLRTKPGRGPSPEAVGELLPLVGFVNRLGACAVWLETLDDGTSAINLVEPLSGNMAELSR